MKTTGNGILVLMDFFTKETEVLPMSYDVFEDFIESIEIDTSKTQGLCFCERDDQFVISVLDYSQIHKIKKKCEYPTYVLVAWGDIFVTLTLTNGEKIKFDTHYDRFWIDTDGEKLKVIKYEDVKKDKVGLK